jgi:hypothetical protein
MEAVAATRDRSEQEQRLEHGAFLSLWLVHFVLPTELSDSTLVILEHMNTQEKSVCARHRRNLSGGPTGVATGCAAMSSTMAMQQQLGHCCPLHIVWWPVAV